MFTDGDDDARPSHLDRRPLRRARPGGIPVCALAQGEAVQSASLMQMLRNIQHGFQRPRVPGQEACDVEKMFAGLADELGTRT